MRKRDHDYFEGNHNQYQGERLFIIGTGPSLKNEIGEDINKLENELTFGVNYLNHCMVDSDDEDAFMHFIPTWWAASEIDFLRNFDMNTAGMDTQRILACELDPDIFGEGSFPDWNWVWMCEVRKMFQASPPRTPMLWFGGQEEELNWVAHAGGVVFDCAVQVAFWMGFQEVYLLGCETTSKGHSYGDDVEGPDRQVERQGMVQASAAHARRVFEKAGRKLVDLSGPTGTLPLDKLNFGEVV